MSRLHPLIRYSCAATLLSCAGFTHALQCSGAQVVDTVLPTGSRWEMCWQTNSAEGITFTDGHFTSANGGSRRKVFKEIGIAEIEVEFDDGSPPLRLVSDDGLGGSHLLSQDASTCGGTLLSNQQLCQTTGGRGYAYKYYSTQKQGYALTLHSISVNGPSAYVVRWRFLDDGTIEPGLGLTGELPTIGTDATHGWPLDNNGNVGIGFTNHVVWRLDLDLVDNTGDDLVEEITATPNADRTRKIKGVSAFTTETTRTLDPDSKRSWRIRDTATTNADGRAVSYHLEPLHQAHADRTGAPGWRAADLAITRHNPCERLAVDNLATGCADNLGSYANGQNVNGADIVLWYTTSYHHLPRSEDLDGVNVHWNLFSIIARDWDAVNPLGGS